MPKISRTFRLDRKLSNALDTIYTRHGDNTYHLERALSEYGPIKALIADKPDKPLSPKLCKEPAEKMFEREWAAYGKKGNKKSSRARFLKLGIREMMAIHNHLPAYVLSTPDKQYRKNFETYINQECWNDEVITKSPHQQAPKAGMESLTDTSWANGMVDQGGDNAKLIG